MLMELQNFMQAASSGFGFAIFARRWLRLRNDL